MSAHDQSRRFGRSTLVALVVANMIGAGVFTTSGFALADLHSPARVMLAWLVGGAIALTGALSYGALARHMPQSGGEYLYLSRAVHPAAGFVAGWVSILAGFTAAIAFAATAFETYLHSVQALPGWVPGDSIAIALILLAAFAHGWIARVGAWGQNALVVFKLAVILLFVVAALTQLPTVDRWCPAADPLPGFDALAFAQAVMWIALSYSGFNAAVYVAEEAHDATHSVPQALLLGTLAVTVIYLVLNSIFVCIPPASVVAGQAAVAVHAARAIGGDALAVLMGIAVALALASSVSSMMMAGPRVYARMATDGLLPRALALDRAAPRRAIVAQAVLAITVVLISELRGLLSYLGFTLSLSAALTVASLFVLRRRAGARAIAMRGYPWVPLIFVIATLTTAVLAAVREPREALAGLLTLGVGLLAWRFRAPRADQSLPR